jgi:hypothetical protein
MDGLASLVNLRTLNLPSQIRGEGFGRLVRLGTLENLHSLAKVTDDDMKPLARNRYLRELSLNSADALTDAGIAELAALQRLESLIIGPVPRMTDAAMRSFLDLAELRSLSLSGAGAITDAGLEMLSRHKKLVTLAVGDATEITDAGLLHLRALSGLRRLDLWSAKATKDGAAELGRALPDAEIHCR